MHYVAMMVVVAGISLYGTSGTDDFKRSYQAASSGEISQAIGHATVGLRRALREADPHQDMRPMRLDARYDAQPRF